MRLHLKLTVGLTMALAMALGGCSCDSTSTTQSKGDPFFKVIGSDGTIERQTSQDVDFGPVLIGTRVERKITVINDGRGPLRVESLVEDEGFDSAFRIRFEPFNLQVSEARDIVVVFEPTREGPHGSSARLVVSDAYTEELGLKITGLGVNGNCLVTPAAPDSLDFGSVSDGTSFIKQVKISNSSDLPWEVEIGGIDSGEDEGAFRFSNFLPGKHLVPAHGDLLVPIEFAPNRVGDYTGTLKIPRPDMCATDVQLKGKGVEDVLECEPRQMVDGKYVCGVNFGFVNPGLRVHAEVAFLNRGNTDLTVTLPDAALVQPAGKNDPYALETAERRFTIPAGGVRVAIPVSFGPTVLGTQAGWLNFESDDPKRPQDRFALQGLGGGPEIKVLPAQLDFGPVATETYQWRKLTIANVGTNVPGTEDDNLRLVTRNDEGVEEPALVELVSNTPDEFELEQPKLPVKGIEANKSAELRVKIQPKTPGLKEATVRIRSNDPAHPVVEVKVVGEGRVMPPCDYEIRPTSVPFGLVEPPKFSQQTIYIVNKAANGQDECLVSMIDLVEDNVTDESKRAFTLIKGMVTGAIIKGGESLEIPVRFQPRVGDMTYTGRVEFYISSPSKPEGRVELTGSSQKGCLMVAPSDLDFGVIGVNCFSRERAFTVYNICSSNVTLNAIDVQTGLSTEFSISQKPVLPKTLAPGDQVDFKARYRPTNIGEDTGTIAIQTAQLTTPYVVTVSGRGAIDAVQTDVFAQDSQPKVDVLLVVDNSCSMSDKQDLLGRNFGSFIKFAVNQKVDYHIAVTTTGVNRAHGGGADNTSPPDENGLFVPVGQTRPTIITPNTPNAQQVFADNVKVGTNGNATELLIRPGYLALSTPNISAPQNVNFLRDEATLAVVTVSDADDQDAVPVSFYQNFFLNIKGFRRANAFSYSGIIPTLPSPPGGGCGYDSNSAGSSMRTRSLVTATGGVFDEICTPDWSKTLEKLGQLTFGYRTRFFLSNLPDLNLPDPIEVKVDGYPYSQFGSFGETRWSYNSTVNAIDFDALSAPEPGTTLEITYHVECLTK